MHAFWHSAVCTSAIPMTLFAQVQFQLSANTSFMSAGNAASEAVPRLAALPQLSGEAAAAALAAWAAAEEHAEWAPMEWLAAEAAPALVSAIRMVPPADETEALRCVAERCCAPFRRFMASGGSGPQVRRLDAALCRASRL